MVSAVNARLVQELGLGSHVKERERLPNTALQLLDRHETTTVERPLGHTLLWSSLADGIVVRQVDD